MVLVILSNLKLLKLLHLMNWLMRSINSMDDIIFLQATDFPGTLLELKNALLGWLEYLPKAINIVLVIWIIAVFFTWRLVSVRSIYGFFFGLFQSFLVFAVNTGLIPCSDAGFYLWVCSGVNLVALFSPVLAVFASRFFASFADSFNAIRDAFIFLFFNCMTFIILNKPHDLTVYDLNDYFSLNNFIEAILPIFVCY